MVVNYRGDLIRWEGGVNRICDLSIMEQIKVEDAKKMQEKLFSSSAKDINKQEQKRFVMGKHLQTKDIWEHFTMQFSIFYPESEGDQLYFKGSKKIRALSDSSMCISSSAEPDPHEMTKSKKDFEWIRVKYGH